MLNIVTIAPLCGSVSRPQVAILARRCKASGLKFKLIYFGNKASMAIANPPEAEAVIPAKEVTPNDHETYGEPGVLLMIASTIILNPSTDATTEPKPTTAHVAITGKPLFTAPSLNAPTTSGICLYIKTIHITIPNDNAKKTSILNIFSVARVIIIGKIAIIGLGKFESYALILFPL